jgi:hypothetical protein
MSRTIQAKKTIGLVALVVAALMVLTAALAASDAEAKKKKKKKLNKVECVQQGVVCNGTARNDLLIGTSAEENIQGGEGNDVYDGRNGQDLWFDRSATSKDAYRVGSAFRASAASGKFEPFTVLDNGGNDTLNFAPFSSDDIVRVSEPFEGQLGIRVTISPGRTGFVSVLDHLKNQENKVESFQFVDRTLTVQEMEDRIERV